MMHLLRRPRGMAVLAVLGVVLLVMSALGDAAADGSAVRVEARLERSSTEPQAETTYLGQGLGIPKAIASAGLGGGVQAWTWGPTAISVNLSAGGPGICSTGTDWPAGGECSTDGLSGSNHSHCSVKAVQGNNQLLCTAFAVPGGTSLVFCSSAGTPAGGNEICSVEQTSNNAWCSASATAPGSTGTASCSAMGGQPGNAYCSADGTPGSNTNHCSAANGTGSEVHCSAGPGSTAGDHCSVTTGSGGQNGTSTCTAFSASGGGGCSTTPGAAGQCSSFVNGWNGAFRPPGADGICR